MSTRHPSVLVRIGSWNVPLVVGFNLAFSGSPEVMGVTDAILSVTAAEVAESQLILTGPQARLML